VQAQGTASPSRRENTASRPTIWIARRLEAFVIRHSKHQCAVSTPSPHPRLLPASSRKILLIDLGVGRSAKESNENGPGAKGPARRRPKFDDPRPFWHYAPNSGRLPELGGPPNSNRPTRRFSSPSACNRIWLITRESRCGRPCSRSHSTPDGRQPRLLFTRRAVGAVIMD